MAKHNELGAKGEQIAIDFLKNKGYQILETNWRIGKAELDIIAKFGKEMIFIEVKTRSGTGYGHPFEAITSIKIARMRKLVSQWCLRNGQTGFDIRLDAIAVLVRNGKVGIEHIKQVF